METDAISVSYEVKLYYAKGSEFPDSKSYFSSAAVTGANQGIKFADAVKIVKDAAGFQNSDRIFCRFSDGWSDLSVRDSARDEKACKAGKACFFIKPGTFEVAPLVDFSRFHESRFVRLGNVVEEDLSIDSTNVLGSLNVKDCYLKLAPGKYGADVPACKLIYVRDDVLELFHEHIAGGLPLWLLYLGQPGTGKSLAGLLVLFHFIKAGKTVIYHKQVLWENGFLMFQEGKFVKVLNGSEAAACLTRRGVFYIEDGAPVRNADSVQAQTILITSPDVQVYKSFRKRTGHPRKFYGTLWTRKELECCRRLVYSNVLTEGECLHRIQRVGCVPRLIYTASDSFADAWSEVLSDLEQADPNEILKSLTKHDTKKKHSHKLLHLERGPATRDGYMVIASATVFEFLGMKSEEKWWTDVFLKYKGLEGSKVHASFRGIAMEAMIHNIFPRRLSAPQRLCQDKHHFFHATGMQLRAFMKMHTIFYSGLDDLLKQLKKLQADGIILQVYCRPRKKNEAAIDSLVVDFERGEFHLLQMTVADLHGTKLHPVNKLIFALSTLKLEVQGLYYVLGDNNYGDFKYQAWRKMKKAADGLTYEECTQPVKHICQFKIQFDADKLILPTIVSDLLKKAVINSVTKDEVEAEPYPMVTDDEISTNEQTATNDASTVAPHVDKLAGSFEVEVPVDSEEEDEQEDEEDEVNEDSKEGEETDRADSNFEVYLASTRTTRQGEAVTSFLVKKDGTTRYFTPEGLKKQLPLVAKAYATATMPAPKRLKR